MNKQEAIEEIKKQSMQAYDDFAIMRDTAIYIVNQINEPEKPVVPQFIDTWIQGAKYNGFDLYEAMTDDEMSDKVATWIVCNSEIFAKAWFFGYEVEKEKLYTARLKLVTYKLQGYINKIKESNALIVADSDKSNSLYQVHFTQAELEKLNVWDNPAFEIEEVAE